MSGVGRSAVVAELQSSYQLSKYCAAALALTYQSAVGAGLQVNLLRKLHQHPVLPPFTTEMSTPDMVQAFISLSGGGYANSESVRVATQ